MPASTMDKVIFLVLSLYVLATEHRFVEHTEKSKNPFYKYLLNYCGSEKGQETLSE